MIRKSRAVDDDTPATQTSTVYERLRDDVISGALAPNMRLPLEMLRDRYGVGITPIREALYRLSSSLLIEAEEQRGFRVTGISLQKYQQIVSARESFETLILVESIRSGDIDWEGRIISAHRAMSRHPVFEAGTTTMVTAAWGEAHHRFHREILSGSNHVFLEHFQRLFWDHADRYRNVVKPAPLSPDVLKRDHDQLLDAVLDRDTDMACMVLRRHIKNGAAATLAALAASGGPVPLSSD
ncbi:MAG: GntR family transcriptional regulator [Rhizobiales bacterium]|nr:GntR family transcriptional regulator [Hyphomicrobiales bacterium]